MRKKSGKNPLKRRRHSRFCGWLWILLTVVLLAAGCGAPDTEQRQASYFDTETVSTAAEDGATFSAEVPEKEKDTAAAAETQEETTEAGEAALDENGSYYSRDEVALYLHLYHALPSNYITKEKARALGWEGGAVEPYAPGKVIGGDRFGNYEGILPEDHTYHECDIDTKGRSRGAKRLVWSDDWAIYYTEDHYDSFTMLYAGED